MRPTQRAHNFGTYFVTANCAQKRRVFQVDANAQLLFEILQEYRVYYRLHAFVIMPDHLHLIVTPNDVALERCMQLIKGGYSREYGKLHPGKGSPWQTLYADHRIRDRDDFDRYKRYIEQNPVVAGLVPQAEDYPWSSCSRILRTGSPSVAEAKDQFGQ